MKKLLLLSILLIPLSVFAAGYNPGQYTCQYGQKDYEICYIMISKSGDQSITCGGMNAPANKEKLLSSGKCSFKEIPTYTCKYAKGTCEVQIFPAGGHEVQCTGDTPDTNKVLEQAKAGQCKKQ